MPSGRVQTDGGVGLLRLRRFSDRFRQSLFFLPALFVIASILLGLALVQLDRSLSSSALPSMLSTTVDNARSILSTVAGGTIGSASVVFSLTLVAVQLASSQFSPRVVRGFLGDRFQQTVMGIVVGTFTYSLVVLRVVQNPLETSNSDPFLPQISVLVAVVLAVASLLAVLASIDHTAKSLRVGALLDQVAAQTLGVVDERFVRLDGEREQPLVLDAPTIVPALPGRQSATATDSGRPREIPSDAKTLRATGRGWVTQISVEGILEAIPEESTALLVCAIGSYLTPGAAVARLWPLSDEDWERVDRQVRDAIEVSKARTLQQDVSFGLLQLTDIAVRALSPGVNDPNTAVEAIVRIGGVLSALLQCHLGTGTVKADGRTVTRGWQLTAHDYVSSAVEPIRRYGAQDPVVLDALARTLADAGRNAQAECDEDVDITAITHELDQIRANLDQLPTAEARNRLRDTLDEMTTWLSVESSHAG